MKELLKSLGEMSIKSLIVGFVMFLVGLSVNYVWGVIFLAIFGNAAIVLVLLMKLGEKEKVPWRYFFASLAGLAILTMIITAINNLLIAGNVVILITESTLVRVFFSMSLTVLAVSPLVLLLWQDEGVKTKWYIKLFGIILCWIVFALLLKLYLTL